MDQFYRQRFSEGHRRGETSENPFLGSSYWPEQSLANSAYRRRQMQDDSPSPVTMMILSTGVLGLIGIYLLVWFGKAPWEVFVYAFAGVLVGGAIMAFVSAIAKLVKGAFTAFFQPFGEQLERDDVAELLEHLHTIIALLQSLSEDVDHLHDHALEQEKLFGEAADRLPWMTDPLCPFCGFPESEHIFVKNRNYYD